MGSITHEFQREYLLNPSNGMFDHRISFQPNRPYRHNMEIYPISINGSTSWNHLCLFPHIPRHWKEVPRISLGLNVQESLDRQQCVFGWIELQQIR